MMKNKKIMYYVVKKNILDINGKIKIKKYYILGMYELINNIIFHFLFPRKHLKNPDFLK